jgi:hypothetical protein
MRRLRLRSTLAALALFLLAACLTVGVPRASAIDPFPNEGILTLSSDHFEVHYNRDNRNDRCTTQYISQQVAGDVLGWAERAYTKYSAWGYPTPIQDTDGNGLIEISVDEFDQAPPACISFGVIDPSIPKEHDGSYSRWDAIVNPVAPSGASEIHLDATDGKGIKFHVVAHEVFHLFTRAVAAGADPWLQEATAEWAAVRAGQDLAGEEINPDRTLDCVGSECGDTDFDRNGYPGWMLFEYLAERYGEASVKSVWDQVAASPGAPGTAAVAAFLPAGTTLARFFNDYTTARMTGAFSLPLLAGSAPQPFAKLSVAETSGSLPASNIAVNHLAVRYLTFDHGSSNDACFEATLTINVAIPAGVESYPTYYAGTKEATAQALSISGSTASITVPWNTCSASPDAYLSLPNDTLGLDGREFAVTGSVSVDFNKPATATSPPPGAYVIGTPIAAPTSDPAPTLKIYAPEVIRVSAKTRLLRFVVFSSGEGKLGAVLGSTGLGSASLRSGNNDVRFVLPTTLFKSLRAKSVSNMLQLTSESPSGAKGATFTRHVVVQTPKPKKKPKKKH